MGTRREARLVPPTLPSRGMQRPLLASQNNPRSAVSRDMSPSKTLSLPRFGREDRVPGCSSRESWSIDEASRSCICRNGTCIHGGLGEMGSDAVISDSVRVRNMYQHIQRS